MASNLFVIIVAVIPFLSSPVICDDTTWQVTAKSRLEISGATNINQFRCLSINYEGQDTIKETCDGETGEPALNGEIVMKSSGFDCHNSIMTRDFARTVNANAFPEIRIKFISLKRDFSVKNENRLFGKVEITLAGKSKLYSVSCVVKEENEESKHLEGNRTFHFSDFGLEPPQKLFGAVKVKDAVSVDFHLKLRSI